MKSVNNSPRGHWAILGGTFDPVHIGHLRIALQLRDAGFERVLLIPNRLPPHRSQPQASAEQRFTMLTLACDSLDGIQPCAIELERSDYSYSAVTVSQLKQQHPNVTFTWVIGHDAWQGFEHWHQPFTLLEQANLLIINRPSSHPESATQSPWQQQQWQQRGGQLSELWQYKQGKIASVRWPELDISASDLRQALKRGDNVTFLTPDAVLEYISLQSLYR